MLRSSVAFGTLLFVVGLVVRLGLITILRDIHVGPQGETTADDVEFNTIALNVARGDGFTNYGRPTSFRAPGWPIFLAGLYKLGGTAPVVVYTINAALGAFSCVLAWLIGREMLDERRARFAGWLAVFYLPHAWFATLYYSENLFVPLLGLAALALIRAMKDRPGSKPGQLHQGLVFVAGLLLGACVLTRPFALLMLPPWTLLLCLRRESLWKRGLAVGLLAGGMGLVVLPWTIRNRAVHGRIVLVATNGGATFYGGNNSKVAGSVRLWGSWVSTTELPGRAEIEAAPTEVSHDGVEWRLGKEWIKANPLKALALLPLKLLRLFFWLPDFDAGLVSLVVRVVCWIPWLLLILAGIASFRANEVLSDAWLIVHSAMLAVVVTALIFWGSPRFRDAQMPLLMLYAALPLIPSRERTDADRSDATLTP